MSGATTTRITTTALVEQAVVKHTHIFFGGDAEGSNNATVISRIKTASEILSGHRIVREVDITSVGYLDASVATDADTALGMTDGAAALGAPVNIIIEGDITEPSWNWTPLQPLYVTGMGLLTQTVPTAPDAFILEVGYATSATTARIHIGIPVIL